jgi:hypothetical protein
MYLVKFLSRNSNLSYDFAFCRFVFIGYALIYEVLSYSIWLLVFKLIVLCHSYLLCSVIGGTWVEKLEALGGKTLLIFSLATT